MPDQQIDVLVTDNSGLMRLIISDILNAEADIKVVDSAVNGKEAVEKTIAQSPDVVVLDMIMDDYDGIYAVKNIMKSNPTPILILSSLGNTDIDPIMKALDLGAIDYLNKPEKNNAKLRQLDKVLVNKVREAASVDIGNKKQKKQVNRIQSNHTFSDVLPYEIIAIGSSTGGPGALEDIIVRLPGNLAVPVVIAQHMPENFIPSFAKRLDGLTPLTVEVGTRGKILRPQHVYIATGDHNVIVKPEGSHVMLDYTNTQFKEFNNPSVDALLESVANVYGPKAIGVILTGMGKDGAKGLKKIKESNGYTIAQDKETCVVYGMPRAAVDADAVNQVVPIKQISGFLVSCLS